ncbi:hypothetical protein LOTGIDRAFT_140100 [Lottia gigantea]|uniref:G-protein coupled receptors family 1 profile domain-containing protein n=1 Tax=Lottia gigantea TaxID=225164 RepID=V4CG46_LOTGI|nr:hypothetical protein LOTGIDRAFT_140100 [Lottia gigantea]ESP01035.1 hypothetical protein LOTGIDRAFT_140100 [Lottia gigantea]
MTFVGLVKIEALDLYGLGLQSLKSNQFYGLDSLERLNISHNSLISIQDQALSDLTRCQILDMRGNNIQSFGGNVFNGLSNLSYLYSDRYTFCCIRPASVPDSQCLPDPDEFSSCSDLMKNGTLRISMWILGIVALMGNLLVLLYRILVDDKDLAKSNGVLVANLGFADFIMGIYMLMIATADVIYRGRYSWNDESWRNSMSCQIAGFLATFSTEASVMFLCLITIDRVIAIKFPFSVFRLKRKSAWLASEAVWILSIVMAAVPLFPLDYFSGKFYSRTGVCLGLPLTKNRAPGWEYGMAVFILWNCVCFIVVAVGQGVIYHTVKRSGQKVRREQKVDMSVARKLSFIVMSDFLCWFPICVMGLMTLRGHIIPGDVYAWVAVFILPVNSALNPIIYSTSSIRPSLFVKKVRQRCTVL